VLRRDVIALIGGATVAWPLAARAANPAAAQRTPEMRRIGVLASYALLPEYRFPTVFRQALAELGWVEGANMALDWREAKGDSDVAAETAAELARTNPDVIVATAPVFVIAAKRATGVIPIVMVNTADPVQLGIVESLVRPGGNITGTSTQSAEVSLKQLDLLIELLPGSKRVAVLTVAANPWHPIALAGLETGARRLGLELTPVRIRASDEIGSALDGIVANGAHALVVLADPVTFNHRRTLAELAARNRLPAVYALREYAEAGGLMSYWAEAATLYRRTAAYVDKILKGAKPSDLPIEQPTRFELIVNLKTAKALGLTIPPSLLARADEVIE
jgi:putative ABC transport system substrate-binding protein